MLRLDAATVLLQWAVGGLFFTWVTTRRREVGIGFAWVQRLVWGAVAALSLFIGLRGDTVPVREAATALLLAATLVALAVSVVRRRAGVAGEHERRRERQEAVAGQVGGRATGIERRADGPDPDAAEFPPVLDLVGPLIGVVGLVAAGVDAGDPALLSVVRVLTGAWLLGAVYDAMLLGHWYLVQPGLGREPLHELVRWTAGAWPFELLVLLWPTGMVSVLNGSIDDGYGGILGWFWVACVVFTIGLLAVTQAALRERQYSAVMAATGLLYLAILTATGMDLVARASLAG